MPTFFNLPWNTQSRTESNNSSSTETLEDEEEVFREIDEEILSQLPTCLRKNLESLQQETFDRLSRTNPSFKHRAQNHHRCQDGREEESLATYETNSNNLIKSHDKQDTRPLAKMEEGPSKYLTVRNPDARDTKAEGGRSNDETEDRKRVQFNLPEPRGNEEGYRGVGSEGLGQFQWPVGESFEDHREDVQQPLLEPTGPWTASARSHTIISGERHNPYAPYTSALREQERSWAAPAKNPEEAEGEEPKKKRKRWARWFSKLIRVGESRKDKK
jgi:hypothetical protein